MANPRITTLARDVIQDIEIYIWKPGDRFGCDVLFSRSSPELCKDLSVMDRPQGLKPQTDAIGIWFDESREGKLGTHTAIGGGLKFSLYSENINYCTDRKYMLRLGAQSIIALADKTGLSTDELLEKVGLREHASCARKEELAPLVEAMKKEKQISR